MSGGWRVAAAAVGWLLLGGTSGCSKSGDGGSPDPLSSHPTGPTYGDAGLLAPCQMAYDCRQGLECSASSDAGFCTQACDGNNPCAAGQCAPQVGMCQPACAAKSDCTACSCGYFGWCSPGLGCQALSDVGGPCVDDYSCKSRNCSRFTKTCRDPVGKACSPATCDICIEADPNSSIPNGSYCSRGCATDADCNGAGTCSTPSGPGAPYMCHATCSGFQDPGCPYANGKVTCSQLSNGSGYVCACEQLGCTDVVSSAFGGPCFGSGNCANGAPCANFDPTLWQTRGGGECTLACAQDSDCPSGSSCISGTLDAADGGAGGGCLPICNATHPCPAFVCASRTDVSGKMVQVCDPHMPGGAPCQTGAQCLSGTCGSQQTCIASGGLPNGSTCSAGSDCASGNCEGTCHGTAQIGDPCSVPTDCSVGTCCQGKCC